MLHFFLELEFLWLLLMFLKINNAIKYVAILNNNAQLKFEFLKKNKFS